MSEPLIWIVAAMEFEAGPLIRRLGLRREGRTWRGGGVRVIVTGVGGERAAGVLTEHLVAGRPQRIIVAGLSGALGPRLRAGDVVRPTEVIDAASGETFVPADGQDAAGRLVSVEGIVSSVAAKAELRGRFAVDLMDMETAAVARVCVERGIAWTCVRAISDEADEVLPAWLGDCVADDGSARMMSFMRHALGDPLGGWAMLVKMSANARRAAKALAEAVAKSVAGH